MINLSDVLMIEMTPGQKEALEIRTRSRCIEEGRAAFLLGVKKSRCPPFRNPVMEEEWRFGWDCEKQDRKAKLPRSRRIFHPEVMEKRARDAACK